MDDVASFGLTAFILFGAYTLFGITGFGQSLVAMPLLAMIGSLKFFVPLMTLLDTVFVLWNMAKFRKQANYSELRVLLPPTIIGMLGGATILLTAPERLLLLALGVLICGYGLYRLLGPKGRAQINRWLAIPLGLVAGAISMTFGTGGPIFVAYLSSRIWDKGELRATILNVIVVTTTLRIIIFGASGLYANAHIWWWWLFALPACFAGVKLGHRLHDRLKSESLLFMIYIILIVSGAALIVKNI